MTREEIESYVWLDKNGCIEMDKTFEQELSYDETDLLTACVKRSIEESEDGNTINAEKAAEYFNRFRYGEEIEDVNDT